MMMVVSSTQANPRYTLMVVTLEIVEIVVTLETALQFRKALPFANRFW